MSQEEPAVASSATTAANATSSRPTGLPQIRPSLSIIVDAAPCNSSSGLPTSTQFGPPTCSMYGPRTSSDSSSHTQPFRNSISTAPAHDIHSTGSRQNVLQRGQHKDAVLQAACSTADSTAPYGSCRKSVRHRVVFESHGSDPQQQQASCPSTSSSGPAGNMSRARTSNRLSTAAAAGLAADVPDTPSSFSTSSSGNSRASCIAGSSSNSPRFGRASSVATAKHYGAWFLPAQDWGYAARLNPGSTW